MYVVFEGIDDAGKTTQMRLVSKRLDEMKRDYRDFDYITIVETRISMDDVETCYPNTEMVLKYALQRLKLLPTITKDENRVVLSDRSYFSSMAYQGLNDGGYWVAQVNRDIPEPDLIFFFKTMASDCFREMVQENYIDILDKPLYEDKLVVLDKNKQSEKEMTDIIIKEIHKKWIKHTVDWDDIER